MSNNVVDTNTNNNHDTTHTITDDTNTIIHASNDTVVSTTVNDSKDFNEDIDVDSLVLSTLDNPYNPKTDYDNWKQWDEDNGYDTESYVARLIDMEPEEFDVDDEITLKSLYEKIVQDILENDVLGVYCLV